MTRIRVRVRQFHDRPTLQLRWRDPVTRQRRTKTTGTTDRREAERLARDLEYELSHGIHAEPARMSWQAFREVLERDYLPARRPGTRKQYARALDDLERECKPAALAGVTTRTITSLASALRAAGLATATLHVRLALLRAVFRWAKGEGLLAEVPGFPRVKLPRTSPQPVDVDLAERLLSHAEPQLRTLLLCAWLCGLRLEEACLLSWEPSRETAWVDLERERIWFPHAGVKGDADSWVPLDRRLRAHLLALPRHGAGVFRFLDRAGWPIKVDSVGARARRLARRVGIPLTMRPLRRGMISRYAETEPAQVVQRIARHADIRTTLRHYASIDRAIERAVLGTNPGNTAPPGGAPSPENQALDG